LTYRDDHDAALARAAALEEELEREHATDAKREERVAKLEAELSQLRGKVERAPATAIVRTEVDEHAWLAVERQINEAEDKRRMATVFSLIGTFALFGVLLVSHASALFVLVPIPAIFGALVASAVTYRCPSCNRAIGGDRSGTAVMLAKSLRKCPRCQADLVT
jgi:hypothetical protein